MSNPYAPPDPSRPPRAPLPAPPGAEPGKLAPEPPAVPVDPAVAARASGLLRTTLLLLLAGLVVSTLSTPWGVASLAFTGTAIVVAGRAARLGLRAHAGPRITVPALALVVASVTGFMIGGLWAMLMPIQQSYSRCQAAALTEQASRLCTAQYAADLSSRRITTRS